MNTVAIRMQIHQAVDEFPTISTMEELRALPRGTLLLVTGGVVWDASAYLTAQGMSSARNGALFTGTARVLWMP
jgi:hypothetical protein